MEGGLQREEEIGRINPPSTKPMLLVDGSNERRFKWCLDGNPDLYIKKNLGLAFQMFERLRAANDPDGTAYFGRMLCRGEGPEKNIQMGLVNLGVAAGKGSTIAAFYLADLAILTLK